MTLARNTSKRLSNFRSWFWSKGVHKTRLTESRPTCSACGKYRSSRYCDTISKAGEPVHSVCSRPACARMKSKKTLTESDFVVEVHHYYHDQCGVCEEKSRKPEKAGFVEVPGESHGMTVTELPTAPVNKHISSIPPDLNVNPPQINRSIRPVFHPR